MNTFVIYTVSGEVLGFVEHVNGDRACAKAEDTIGRFDLVWNSWENATPADRKTANRKGAIT